MKLNVKAAGFAGAILYGGALLLLTLWLVVRGLEGHQLFLERVYPGYHISGFGSLIGLVYGLIDGFIGGVLFAWLYNFFSGGRTGTPG